MVQGFMKEKFVQGVKTYLDCYKFANAETNDLWKHLSQVQIVFRECIVTAYGVYDFMAK